MKTLSRHTSPAKLLALFVMLAGVPLFALGWLGWRVLQQDRALELQRSRERLETAADVLTREFERTLAGWEDVAKRSVSGGPAAPPAGAVLLISDDSGIVQQASARLHYLPGPRPLHTFPPSVFAAGEEQEFRDGNLSQAVSLYRVRATSSNSSIRAAALMRLARVLRKQGQMEAALAEYERLAAMGEVDVAGSPSELVARHERMVLLKSTGQHGAAAHEASLLRAALSDARFAIDRSAYDFFREALISFDPSMAPNARVPIADAAYALWPAVQEKPSGRAASSDQSGAFIIVWHKGDRRTSAVLTTAENLVTSAGSRNRHSGLRVALENSSGHPVWGSVNDADVVFKRALHETGLPWSMQIASADPLSHKTTFGSQRALFAASLGLMVFVVAAAGYFVFTAVNKELGVARLQSDFVAAVSHEFRTPLTAMCHLTEILEEGKTSPGRVAEYHRALAKESRRLHAMVESLLDFGRIDSGRRTYELREIDAVAFVDETLKDFREQRAEDGARIRFLSSPAMDALVIRADRNALAVALRNLIDNAVKYSPPSTSVTVSVASSGQFVGISVDDEGPGVLKDEAKAIFRKFARGAAARSTNVKGTGIGLTMAAEIVRAHGGRLELAIKPGRGSRFTTFLPSYATRV